MRKQSAENTGCFTVYLSIKLSMCIATPVDELLFNAMKTIYNLELIYYFTYFFTVVPSNSCVFLSCRPFVINVSTGLVGVEVSSVSWLGQLTVEV